MRRITRWGVVVALFWLLTGIAAAEKWPGIDEAVVNRIAREQGHEPGRSLLPEAEGDLQLFLFLLAGAAGGFIAGYCWRVLTEGRRERK